MHGFEFDDFGIDEFFASMLKIHRDAGADNRLHLSDPPIRFLGVADEISGCDECRHEASLPANAVPMLKQVGRGLSRLLWEGMVGKTCNQGKCE